MAKIVKMYKNNVGGWLRFSVHPWILIFACFWKHLEPNFILGSKSPSLSCFSEISKKRPKKSAPNFFQKRLEKFSHRSAHMDLFSANFFFCVFLGHFPKKTSKMAETGKYKAWRYFRSNFDFFTSFLRRFSGLFNFSFEQNKKTINPPKRSIRYLIWTTSLPGRQLVQKRLETSWL